MKKLFLGVMVFAFIITSCNKYANDFQQLKDQIAALSLKVDGVAALQTQLTATTAQITALQAAVAGLPQASSISALQTALTTANTNIGAIQTQLNTLATTGATKASVEALATQLKAIGDGIAANDLIYKQKFTDLQKGVDAAATSAQLADAQSKLLAAISASAATTNDSITALEASIKDAISKGLATTNGKIADLADMVDKANKATAASIEDILGKLATAQTTASSTNDLVKGLVIALNKAQSDLTTLLNATAMYNDDVTITTDAEVDFYLAKLYQLGIINGNVLVNTNLITKTKIAQVDSILNAIVGVIGQNTVSKVTLGGNHHNSGTFTITTTAGDGHWVAISSVPADALSAVKLYSIRGNYSVFGGDVVDTSVDNVGGTVLLNYPGSYVSASLKTVGMDLVLWNIPGATLDINIPNVTIGGNIGDGTHAPNGIVTFSNPSTVTPLYAGTKWINLGLLSGGIRSLTTSSASTISIGTGSIALAGLAITAPIATTVTLLATASAGPVTIATGTLPTTGTATTVDISKLVTSGTLTIWAAAAGNVMLDKLNTVNPVDIEGPLTLLAPVWEGNPGVLPNLGASLNAPLTTTLTLPTYHWWSVTAPGTIPSGANLAAITKLTLGNAAESVALAPYTTLKWVSITGVKVVDATHPADMWATITPAWHAPGVTATAADAVLAWVELHGVMNIVTLTALPKLVTLATDGVINSFTLASCPLIVQAALGHNAFVGNYLLGGGGPGSDLTVTGNALLAGLAPTAIDWLHTLTVTGNPSLVHFDFHTYTNQLYSQTSANVTIDATAVVGAYVPGVGPQSAGNPGIQAIIKSNDIMTIKPYLTGMLANTHITTPTYSINIGIAGPPVTTLTLAMGANAQIWNFGYINKVTAPAGLNSVDELTLVVAQ